MFISTLVLLRMKKHVAGIAVLCFAMLSAVATTFIGQEVSELEERITSSAGISSEQLQKDIDARLQIFNEEDALLLVRHITADPEQRQFLSNDHAFAFIVNVAPWVFLSFLLNTIILFIACVFFLLLAGGSVVSGYQAASQLPIMLLKMLFLMFWFFVRSFLWIPFLGPPIALLMIPRLILAPAILANGTMGVLASTSESLRRTKHRWFQVLFSLLGLVLSSAAFLFLAMMIVSIVTLLSLKLGFLLWLLLLLGTVSFQMFFLMILSERMA